MIRRTLVGLALAFTFMATQGGPAQADSHAHCGAGGGLTGVAAACIKSGSETLGYVADHPQHVYTISPVCKVGGQALCAARQDCHTAGHPGLLYFVFEDGRRLDWQACLTDHEAAQLGAITPAQVQHAFQHLSWPASSLVIEPPKGRTLVNFDTNFYTTNTAPTTKSVTLLGQAITIEATPVDYTWRFGAGATQTTSDPGAPYPDLRITYRYLHPGSVSPAVDTTYAGRYRIGNGQWRTIPATLTVTGATQQLQVLTATPHLVGY